MTEKELIEIQIAHLQGQIKEKQKKLEKLEKTKSPVEEAFKRVYSYYPEGCETSVWVAFQKAYEEAQKDYKVGKYQETTQEPEVEPSMTNCVITGNPPDGYVTWQEWYNELGSKGILHNLRISSIESIKQEVREWDVVRESMNWWNDGKGNTKMSIECPEEGWVPGR